MVMTRSFPLMSLTHGDITFKFSQLETSCVVVTSEAVVSYPTLQAAIAAMTKPDAVIAQ